MGIGEGVGTVEPETREAGSLNSRGRRHIGATGRYRDPGSGIAQCAERPTFRRPRATVVPAGASGWIGNRAMTWAGRGRTCFWANEFPSIWSRSAPHRRCLDASRRRRVCRPLSCLGRGQMGYRIPPRGGRRGPHGDVVPGTTNVQIPSSQMVAGYLYVAAISYPALFRNRVDDPLAEIPVETKWLSKERPQCRSPPPPEARPNRLPTII